MNAPHKLQEVALGLQSGPQGADTDDINLAEYLDIALDNRWLIGGVTAVALLLGGSYAWLAKPVYETNLLIQVEDSSTSAKSFLGDAASLFDIKTPATAEMEIIRSRMVIGKAVDNTRYFIDARPRYLPLIGGWLARRANALSNPGVFGLGGWVHGTEAIKVGAFDVPPAMEDTSFTLTALGGGRFSLTHTDLEHPLIGAVGVPAAMNTTSGPISITVDALAGKPGAQFRLTRFSRLATIEALQEKLKLTEKGRDSGIIDATLADSDRQRLTQILNEIATQYVKQNIERKAAEAQKTLAFLDVQLPQLKKQLEQAEDAYTRYRNREGTISLSDEAQTLLQQSVDLQGRLMDAQQKRLELVSRFTPEHPAVKTLDAQIAAWRQQISSLNARVKTLPSVQQDALRLERDVKVNNELYEQLRNNALQLQLIREGKTGNVRLIDGAAMPEEPVRPKRALTLAVSLLLGLLTGSIIAFTRNAFFRGIRSSQEIEAYTGLNVYSVIPLSEQQKILMQRAGGKLPGVHILAESAPQDPAVESLRSLRTALKFAMLDSQNNCVLITGATPSVGKSFVSANFAAVLASAGKRVLLIDADLRKGHLNQYFGIGRNKGLSELIAGSLSAHEAVQRDILPNLDLITTGILPPNPAELLVNPAFASAIETFAKQYDIVLIDSAPVLVASDTLSAALHAATVLLVARAEQTQLGELEESSRRLSHAGASVTGVLLNAVDLHRRHYGTYGYKYGGYQYRTYEYAPMKNRS